MPILSSRRTQHGLTLALERAVFLVKLKGWGCIWAKWGRFVIFPVLCLLAYGDTALKSEFLLAFGAHKKGCNNDTFRAVSPTIWVSWDLKTLQNKGKRKMTIDPALPPHRVGVGAFAPLPMKFHDNSSGRPSLELLLEKEASLGVLGGGGEHYGDAPEGFKCLES